MDLLKDKYKAEFDYKNIQIKQYKIKGKCFFSAKKNKLNKYHKNLILYMYSINSKKSKSQLKTKIYSTIIQINESKILQNYSIKKSLISKNLKNLRGMEYQSNVELPYGNCSSNTCPLIRTINHNQLIEKEKTT